MMRTFSSAGASPSAFFSQGAGRDVRNRGEVWAAVLAQTAVFPPMGMRQGMVGLVAS